MHGLINRAVQCFVRDTYGVETWERLARKAGVPLAGFESMFVYDDAMTDHMLRAVDPVLNKPLETFLEDLGTYLVSNSNIGSVRRLLRFGGETFVEFLLSIDELPRRARLAMPELILPPIEVLEEGNGLFRVSCKWEKDGFGHVLVGVLRTMADDYGALVVLERQCRTDQEERLVVQLLADGFAEARPFNLAVG